MEINIKLIILVFIIPWLFYIIKGLGKPIIHITRSNTLFCLFVSIVWAAITTGLHYAILKCDISQATSLEIILFVYGFPILIGLLATVMLLRIKGDMSKKKTE